MKYNVPTSSDQLPEFKEMERIELAEYAEARELEEIERIELAEKTLKEQAGLIHVGKNDEGERIFMGTKEQWNRYEEKWGPSLCEWDEEDQE